MPEVAPVNPLSGETTPEPSQFFTALGEADDRLRAENAQLRQERDDAHVVGFITQCATCPQRAVLRLQPATDWQCPRCTPHAAPQTPPDADWPIGEVCG